MNVNYIISQIPAKYHEIEELVVKDPVIATGCTLAMKVLAVALFLMIPGSTGIVLIMSAILGGALILGSLPIDVAIFRKWSEIKPKLQEIKFPDVMGSLKELFQKELVQTVLNSGQQQLEETQ